MEKVKVHGRNFKKFIAHEDILAAVSKLSERINKDYEGKTPLILSVLNGAFMFTSDLMKGVTLDCELQFIKVASYQGTESTGQVKSMLKPGQEVEGRHLIIVEDIIDTGNTYEYLLGLLKPLNPASIKAASLLYKPNAYTKPFPIDYIGLEVGNEFLIGYGLDYDGFARNLKDIYVLDED